MSEHLVELEAAWQRHVGRDRGRLDDLVARHREPHRRYHGVAHLVWVVRHVLELATHEPVGDVGAVVAAACYHDAVYVASSDTNEEASARVATADLDALGWAPERVERVTAMIVATADHSDPVDVDTAVLLDADLAVLAADPADYDDYARGVRAEYDHVADGPWRTGRAAVLRSFLARDHVYSTPTARVRWEHRARANLTAELATLVGRDRFSAEA